MVTTGGTARECMIMSVHVQSHCFVPSEVQLCLELAVLSDADLVLDMKEQLLPSQCTLCLSASQIKAVERFLFYVL